MRCAAERTAMRNENQAFIGITPSKGWPIYPAALKSSVLVQQSMAGVIYVQEKCQKSLLFESLPPNGGYRYDFLCGFVRSRADVSSWRRGTACGESITLRRECGPARWGCWFVLDSVQRWAVESNRHHGRKWPCVCGFTTHSAGH